MKVLVVAPHMDDEVLGCGGTIVRHVQAGDEVCVCFAANRAYGHRYDPVLIAEQKACAEKARDILGYHRAYYLGLNDEQLDGLLIRVIVPIEEVVQELKPDVVYVNHRGDTNQDHRAVFQAVLVACRVIASHRVKRLLSYEVPSSTDQAAPYADCAFLPNYYVNIESGLEKKVRAMAAYGREIREFPHPRSADGIRIYAKKRGMEIGLASAEAFMILRDLAE